MFKKTVDKKISSNASLSLTVPRTQAAFNKKAQIFGNFFFLYSASLFFSLSEIMDLRHQSSSMCIIKLGEKTHTHGLQRK